jgi:hypothetical protein
MLVDKRLRALLVFDAQQSPAPDFWRDPVTGQASDRQAALRRLGPGVAVLARALADGVVAHRLTGLAAELTKIAEATQNPEVRKILDGAANYLKNIDSDSPTASASHR